MQESDGGVSSSNGGESPDAEKDLSDPYSHIQGPSSLPQTLVDSPTSVSSVHESFKAMTLSELKAKGLLIKDLYHVFLDQTGFEYNILLIRSNPSINSNARYELTILESHTKPHVYCAISKYSPSTRPAMYLQTSSSIPNTSQDQPRAPQSCPTEAATSSGEHSVNESAYPAHLESLIKPPPPDPCKVYKAFLTPLCSSFKDAFRAFRHAFRDVSLLAWEERYDQDYHLQITRAKQYGLEPYVYSKPARGMPIGLLPQISIDLMPSDAEDGYIRNRFGLPGIDEPLGAMGVIGRKVQSEKEMLEKEKEIEKVKEPVKRVRYNKPLFDDGRARGPISGPGRWNREQNWPSQQY